MPSVEPRDVVNGEARFAITDLDLSMAVTMIDALQEHSDRILMEMETYRRRERSGLAFDKGNWRQARLDENGYRSAEDMMFLGHLLGEVNKLIFLLRDETKDA